jgi:hypothetical protein
VYPKFHLFKAGSRGKMAQIRQHENFWANGEPPPKSGWRNLVEYQIFGVSNGISQNSRLHHRIAPFHREDAVALVNVYAFFT